LFCYLKPILLLSFKTVKLSTGNESFEALTNPEGLAFLQFSPENSKGVITASFQDSEFKANSTLRFAQLNWQGFNALLEVFAFLAGYFFIFLIAKHCLKKIQTRIN